MKAVQNLKLQIDELKKKIELKDALLDTKSIYIKQLEAAIKGHNKHRFGSKSEKTNKNQLSLFNEAELIDDENKETTKPKKPKKKKTGTRKNLPSDLERIDKNHDLSDDEKQCPHDNSKLKHIGEIVTEKLHFVPAVIKVIRHKQFKYVCTCCNKHIVTAKKPKDIIPKSIATADLLSHICNCKYSDGLPLYRLSNIFKRMNINISRANLSNWVIKCSIAIQPLINMIQDEIYAQPCMHIDETHVLVLKEVGKKAQTKSQMWVMKAGNNVLFNYAQTRGHEVVDGLLQGYDGAIMTDGYKAYDDMAIKHLIVHLACWVHARRYFIKVLDNGPNVFASKMIDLIGKLYAIEKQVRSKEPDEIFKYRQKHSKPVLQEIKDYMDEILHSTAPSGALGKALKYMQGQWSKLVRYIEDGNYPIDNNPVENAIRPFVIGRKNWLFANTPNGAHASANMYSLIETAKAYGVNTYDYLAHVFKQLPLVETVDEYEQLLPKNFLLS